MGGVASTLSLCLGYCACKSVSSLCNACCGNTDSSSYGRKRSVLVLAMAVALAFAFQYGVAPALYEGTSNGISVLPYVGGYLVNAWNNGCEEFESEESRNKCIGNAGVYRVASCSFLFFAIAAIASKIRPAVNREAWPAKYAVFILLVLSSAFIPNSPLFLDIFQPIAWTGGAIFILIQQIILIDLAYNWNESWVDKSNKAELEEHGSGSKWLTAILITCALLYCAVIAGIVLLFVFFSGCTANEVVLSITLILVVAITAIQLSGEEGSLLTSAVISVYAVYLAFSSVTKNPDGQCNPSLGHDDVVGIALGIGLTFIALAWTGWSWTARERLSSDGVKTGAMSSSSHEEDDRHIDLDLPLLDEEPAVGGVVMENAEDNDRTGNVVAPDIWKLNAVLALVSCWFAVSLTGWGGIHSEGDAANPQVGHVNLWVIICCQWLALGLYAWTLIAPRLFPDRDFD